MSKQVLTAGLISATLICLVNAEPGAGIHSGPWSISPFVDERATYDSNIYLSHSSEKDDVFADSTFGLRTKYNTEMIKFDGLGFLSQRNYCDATEKDAGDGGETLRAKIGNRDQIELSAAQSFRHVNDIDRYAYEPAIGGISRDSALDIASRSQRNINQAEFSAGKNMSDKLELDAGYRFDEINYASANLFDLCDHVGQVESAYQLTDKTAGFLVIKGALQENLSQSTEAEYYAARIGLKTKGTDKVSLKGGAGFEYYTPVTGNDETKFNFDFASSWHITDKIFLQAGGYNDYQMSEVYTGNSIDYQVFWIGGDYQVTSAISTSLGASYRIDNYINPLESNSLPANRKDQGFGESLRINYQAPIKFLRIYAQASHEDTTSDISSYNETRIAMGAILTY